MYMYMYTHLFKIIFAKVGINHQSKLYLKFSSKTITFVILQYFIIISGNMQQTQFYFKYLPMVIEKY